MKLIITSNQSIFLIILTTCVLLLGMTVESYADAGPEYTPTQPNAVASYDSLNNQIQVEWDFNSLPADTTCLLKGDISYNENLAGSGQEDAIPSFTPRFYSPITSTPVTFEAANAPDKNQFAEEVSCTGETRIDIDTLINHSENTNNFSDMQIFLTFYVPVNGDFNNENPNRIDEVFVMYAPGSTYDQFDKQGYGCNGQIGSTLFIDSTGIHGNNGDNCEDPDFKYVSLNSNEWVDIGMKGSGSYGVETKGDHTAETFPLLYLVSYPVAAESTGGGGSSNDHKSRPTFGLDHNTYVQAVDVGLTINDVSFVVTDNYWTPIPMQNLTIGDVQNFTATTYAPKTLHFMEFLFGIPAVGDWDKAESSVTLEFDYRGDIIEIMPKNTDDIIINYNTMNYSSSISKCKVDSNTPTCNTVSIEVIFNEAPIGTVMALQAIDYKGRTNILYFNDGIDLDGDSQNPPLTMEITSPVKYKGMQTIQRVDKVNDTWMTLDDDEPVSLYQRNSFGTFNPIEWRTLEGTSDEMSEIMNRYHSEFSRFVESEYVRALDVFDSSLIQGTVTPSFAYEFPHITDRHSQLAELIDYEIKRAEFVFSEKYTME